MSTGLFLYNTLTRRKERFKPRQAGNSVKMFTCGPSIYAWPHIGNFRTFLFEDILQRYLEYLGYNVQRLINFTDVEDKAIRQAAKTGVSIEALTEPVAQSFIDDCTRLKIKLPEIIPRSSTSVDQAVTLIEQLLQKGYAYRHGIDIFYDPLKFKDFGKLFRLDMSRWPEKKTRFNKDTYSGNRWNLGDFILWKGRRKTDGEVYWKTSLGEGRPAWNIQDPAMITKHLGYTTDIWCGGIDNLYRHHDYNIAVIEAVSGKKLSNFWLHCEHVLAGKKKMSKSLGNIIYIKDLLDKGYKTHHIRFFLLYPNFRERLDMNDEKLQLARGKVDTLRDLAKRLDGDGAGEKSPLPAGNQDSVDLSDKMPDKMALIFEERMNDNLDVRGAFNGVYDHVTQLAAMKARGELKPAAGRQAVDTMKRIEQVLQILC